MKVDGPEVWKWTIQKYEGVTPGPAFWIFQDLSIRVITYNQLCEKTNFEIFPDGVIETGSDLTQTLKGV